MKKIYPLLDPLCFLTSLSFFALGGGCFFCFFFFSNHILTVVVGISHTGVGVFDSNHVAMFWDS
jgi:hypothetical protein